MHSNQLWDIFLATGSPEAYLLYTQSKRAEEHHVSDNKSAGSARDRLQ